MIIVDELLQFFMSEGLSIFLCYGIRVLKGCNAKSISDTQIHLKTHSIACTVTKTISPGCFPILLRISFLIPMI